jgi:hypothetical protein
MRAVLQVHRPGENDSVHVIDFDGDLDGLLRPLFGGRDFEHLYVEKGGQVVDLFVEKDDKDCTGTMVLLESISWVEPRDLPMPPPDDDEDEGHYG